LTHLFFPADLKILKRFNLNHQPSLDREDQFQIIPDTRSKVSKKLTFSAILILATDLPITARGRNQNI
jgi:hypothetical protein